MGISKRSRKEGGKPRRFTGFRIFVEGGKRRGYGRLGRSGLGLSLVFRGGGRFSFRSLVMTFTRSLGGRFSCSFRCANAPADTTPSIAITKSCRISLIIFSLFSSASLTAHWREKESRCPRGSKKGATKFWAKVYHLSAIFAPFRISSHGIV